MDYFTSIARARGEKIYLAFAGELGLELLYATGSVHKAFFTSKCRVGIHSDIPNEYMTIDTIHIFSLLGTGSGKSVKFFTGRNINKCNRVEVWMNIFFHRCKKVWLQINLGVL